MFSKSYGVYFVSGMAVARDIKGRRERVVAVISNWTTMSGQIYEAMSNAGYLDSNMVVILNDSRHSLLPKIEEGSKTSVNALSSTLSRLQSSKSFRKFREAAKVCILFSSFAEKLQDICKLAFSVCCSIAYMVVVTMPHHSTLNELSMKRKSVC